MHTNKFIKTLSLSRNIFYTFLTQIPIQIFGIISGILIARLLGPEGKGAYAIYHANAQLLVTFFSFSLNTALIYFLSSGKGNPSKILGLSILFVCLGTLLMLLMLGVFSIPYVNRLMIPSGYNGGIFFYWMGIFSFFTLANTIVSGFFQGYKKFGIINKIAIYNSILSLFLIAAVFFLNRYDYFNGKLIHILWILAVVAIINFFQYLYKFFKHFDIKPDFKTNYKEDAYPVLYFLIPAHLSIVVNFFNYRLNLWVLNYYLDEVVIGLFALAVNISAFFTMISVPISKVLMPYLSSEPENNRGNIFSRYSRLNFSLIFFGAIISFLLAEFLIPLVYGKDFAGSVVYFKWILPGILFGCQTKIFSAYIIACGRQKYNLYATIIALIANTIFSIVLIPMIGGMGAVWAYNITNFTLLIVGMGASHYALSLPVANHYFLTMADIKRILKDAARKK
ncbi:MAG: oligosaccharide flippase family protein [bacterium]